MHGVLQFIEREKQPKILELLKKWTNINGYHIVALFTDEEPVPIEWKKLEKNGRKIKKMVVCGKILKTQKECVIV